MPKTLIDQKLETLMQIDAEKSRRLHDVLVQCDEDLRALDENPFQYRLVEVILKRKAIIRLRKQARDEIEALTK